MLMFVAMLMLFAFLFSIARETRDYTPRPAANFDDYMTYLYDQYGGVGFSARCIVLAGAEGLFLLQILQQ